MIVCASGGEINSKSEECMRNFLADLAGRGADRNVLFSQAWEANQKLLPPVPVDRLLLLIVEATQTPVPAGADGARAAVSPSDTPSAEARVARATGVQSPPNYLPANSATQDIQDIHRSPTTPNESSCEEKMKAGPPVDMAGANGSVETLWNHLCRAYEKRNRGRRRGRWSSPLFGFLRLAKSHPELRGVTPKRAFAAVESVLRSWSRKLGRAKEEPWSLWFGVDRHEAEAEFLSAWDKIRYLPGDTPLKGAYAQAARCTFGLRPEIAERRPEFYPLFVSLAGWLQVEMGDRNILLPLYEVAELLGRDRATVSYYRRWACEDGYLVEVAKAEHGKGKAAEFRFDVSRFESLKARAQEGTQEGFDTVTERAASHAN